MTRTRQALLHVVLGAWLAVSACTIAGAVLSFRVAPEAATTARDAESTAAAVAARAGRAQAMRFNGVMFTASGRAQLILAGLALLLAAWPGGPSRACTACLGLAALLTAALALGVTPRSTGLAQRRIAALEAPAGAGARAPDATEDERFRRLHRLYGLLDLTKSLLVVAGGVTTLAPATSRR